MGIIIKKRIIILISLILFFTLWGISYFNNSDFNSIYTITCLGLFIVNVLSLFFIYKKTLCPLHITILIILLGTLYNFILPACTVPDEDIHFAAAYKVSNCILYGNTINEQSTIMLMRPDISNSIPRDYHGYELLDYYNQFLCRSNELDAYYDNPEIVDVSLTYYQYILSGIVISFCRVFKLGARMLLFVGREANLFLFSLLIFLSIKKLPQMATTISILALFPMTLILAASYSYDSIIIPATILYFSIVMKNVLDKKKISTKEMIIISLLFVFVAPIKLVYLPEILLLFCLDKNLFSKTWHKITWISSILLLTGLIMLISKGSYVNYLFNKQPPTTTYEVSHESADISSNSAEAADSIHSWTITDIKSDPLGFVGVLFRSLFDTSNQLFMNISGYYFGWFTYEIPITIACIFPILFGISIITSDLANIYVSKKLILSLIIVSSFFLIMLAMLLVETPYGSAAVVGVQGRYFIPLMPLVAVVLNFDDFKVHGKNSSSLICISVFMNSIVNLYLLNTILK